MRLTRPARQTIPLTMRLLAKHRGFTHMAWRGALECNGLFATVIARELATNPG